MRGTSGSSEASSGSSSWLARLRRRPPRFALVLSGLAGLTALLIVAVGGGPAAQGPRIGGAQLEPSGPGHACQGSQARVRATARSQIVASATATVPVRVQEAASGPRGTIVVTRSASYSYRDRTTRPVAITAKAVARARACARGSTVAAARGRALRRAYALALDRARRRAKASAHRAVLALEHRLRGSVLAEARSQAERQARSVAQAARPGLARAARARAVREARRT